MHYMCRMARVKPETRRCTVAGCSRLFYARGWCRPHWSRHWRTGDLDLQDRGRPWTPGEDAVLMDLETTRNGRRAVDHTVVALAREMGRTKNSLCSRRCILLKSRAF